MAMIFYQTLEDVCDWKLTGILNNVEPVLYYSIVKSSQWNFCKQWSQGLFLICHIICIVGIVKNINDIVSACLALSVCLHVNILNLASQNLNASALVMLARVKRPRLATCTQCVPIFILRQAFLWADVTWIFEPMLNVVKNHCWIARITCVSFASLLNQSNLVRLHLHSESRRCNINFSSISSQKLCTIFGSLVYT